MNEIINTIQNIDCLSGLKLLPDAYIQCIVTSPPYYGLRDYGVEGQIGQEKTPEKYIQRLVKVFHEAKRVLADDGVLWVNVGDSYASAAKNRTKEQAARKSTLAGGKSSQIACKDQPNKITEGLKAKDLIGIPWMLAFALRADGWYLRQDIIWHKPNPMPESVTDRCTRAHEFLFMLTKKAKYYYDADAIKTYPKNYSFNGPHFSDAKKVSSLKRQRGDKQRGHSKRHAGFNEQWDQMTTAEQMSMPANKRSVWTVATKPFSDAHFAVFPEELIVDCIKSGSRVNDIILDPFMGAGTTALVSAKHGRRFVGFELNKEYINISIRRMEKELGIFNPCAQSPFLI